MKNICFDRWKTIVNNQRDILILGEILVVIQAAEQKTITAEKVAAVRFLFTIGLVRNIFEGIAYVCWESFLLFVTVLKRFLLLLCRPACLPACCT